MRKVTVRLTSEERASIKRLQQRKKQIRMYGDDLGVKQEVREVQDVINKIKINARHRAEGKATCRVPTAVPYNVYIDKEV